jgi:hypothetical protein
MGGGGDTTNVTNTGLGDAQFQTLTGNQANIASSIDATSANATNRFNTVDGTLSNIRGDISGVGTNLSSGFTNLQDLLGQNMQANQRGFTDVNQNINQSTGQIQSGMNAGFTGVTQNLADGFGTMDERFNRVDTAQQTAQTAIDTGFQDQTNAFSDLDTRLTDDFNTANQNMTGGFAEVGQSLSDLDANTQNRLDTVQGNVLTGQAILDRNLGQVANAQDIYYGDLSGRQLEIQQGQDEFRSNFDDYVQRYSDDTTLANQTRADIQTGLVNATGMIRTDLGNFAQAAATGNAALSTQMSDSDRASRDALGNLNTAVQGGFTGQAMSAQQAQQNLVTRLGNLGSMVDTVGTTLDSNTRQQYSSLMSSFDSNGNLIRNSIDAQGNTIQRSMDAQGNLILTQFDQAGSQIGQVSMNVDQMLTQAERYQQSLSTQIRGVEQGLMSNQQQQFTGLEASIGRGFNASSAILDRTARDMAAFAAGQGDLNNSMRSQFSQLSQAFDQNGRLIQNSILDNGNIISRAVDDNGNLLLRSFDATGRTLGNQVININRALSELSALPFQAGANASMGNLSPAMTGTVPQAGFATPYSLTR